MSDSLPPPSPAHSPPKTSRRRCPPGLLRREDAARYCRAGKSTWDRWTAAGWTPAPIKLGGAVYWSRAELAEWCRHHCPPRAEWQPVWTAILAARRAGRAR